MNRIDGADTREETPAGAIRRMVSTDQTDPEMGLVWAAPVGGNAVRPVAVVAAFRHVAGEEFWAFLEPPGGGIGHTGLVELIVPPSLSGGVGSVVQMAGVAPFQTVDFAALRFHKDTPAGQL
jgi:hypothetical protein